MVTPDFLEAYRNKRIFITGHTGFKGSWLVYALQMNGAIVKGYALSPETNPSLHNLIKHSLSIESVIADINEAERVEKEIVNFKPDFIFHLAAQPLVRKSYKEPLSTFATNINGTANVLNALLKLDTPCSCIMITTDKVYENKEWHYSYRETDRLGGYDPYSASKACAELVIDSFRKSFFHTTNFEQHQKAIISVRAGNVIGGGDWSDDRLIPDIIKSIISDKEILIRNPQSVRPWQHVLEPVFGYLQLGAALAKHPQQFAGAWNFGPAGSDNLPVINIAQAAIGIWGKGRIEIPEQKNKLHEAGLLKLDISKVTNELGWKPKMDTTTAVERTIQWYKSFYEEKKSAASLMEADVLHYQSLFN